MDHRQLVADLVRHLDTSEEVVFTGARRRKTGCMSGMDTERALDDLGKFRRTGEAPEYVQTYALDYLGQVKKTFRAQKRDPLLGGIDPRGSLVGSLSDQEDDGN